MINYIIQVVLCQVFFLVFYDLFLSKETFFKKNRGYLLSTPILSFILPFIKIQTFQKVLPEKFFVYLPEIVIAPNKIIEKTTFYQSINYVNIIFWIGVSVFTILFLSKLIKIFILIKKYQIEKKEGFTLVHLSKQTTAFSFFNYIFLGKEIPESQKSQIIEHELVHSKQRHSLDLLFFEFLKIVMWFNPMIFIYQKRITLVHEYISDEIATKLTPKENYINNLLSNFFQVENIAFVNQFYKQTLIKKRIIMMTKNKSKKMNQLKYLVLIPVLASLLFYISCTKTSKNEEIEPLVEVEEIIEVVEQSPRIENTNDIDNGEIIEVEESVSFMTIEKTPNFPGCNSGDKDCFNRKVQKHFIQKFDSSLMKTLGLSPGRKRVSIMFKIDKTGIVDEIKVRAPHPKIKEEVIRVMSLLPQMIPGEQDGEKVAVKYSIPFTLFVEDTKKKE
ncbi:energy transducer TonB [Polaribacter haliotis]|uniref:Energy transducer TonB n=1 Tax=Polaribacter haliotis TaxID=1888915 RepID=A0A7L8AF54_9FLAO|nr:M56 family metallopeptidase [Polaribacter haliotis]QOD60439.1 energy transducer TonB [Polaribacter haliotis]